MVEDAAVASMLRILLATCETTLDTLRAAANPADRELTELLGKMIMRTRAELAALKDPFARP